ncbi:MAG TPA: NlpC/P60 family protein [Patescibacteria group bacterium]|nr:NlpC/P60 family protein [Patescibacteria group bacterium]
MRRRLQQFSRRYLKKGLLVTGNLSMVVCLLTSSQTNVFAMTSAQKSALDHGVLYFNTEEGCGADGTADSGTTVPPPASPVVVGGNKSLHLTATQIANAKTIISVSKLMGLSERGALIGLMTSLQESHIYNLTNTSNVPLSTGLANEGNGGDHTSLGVMQQQTSTGWSTYEGDSTHDIRGVKQILDVSYAAEAFFGIPKGANITYPPDTKNPGAVKKGLQNRVPNYQTIDPGVAAQTVQVSAFPLAYSKWQITAQAILDAYYASPNVVTTLPIGYDSVPASTSSTSSDTGCAAFNDTTSSLSGGCNNPAIGKFFSTICAYSHPVYVPPNYFTMTPAYAAAVAAHNGYVGGGAHPGVDCGGFVTQVFRNSGADPNYNDQASNVVAQYDYVRSHPSKYKILSGVKSSKDLQPGDIYFESGLGHTYIYVGPGLFTNYTAASASFSTTGHSWRTPMASKTYGFTTDHWVRPLTDLTKV